MLLLISLLFVLLMLTSIMLKPGCCVTEKRTSVAFYKRDLPVSDLCFVTISNEAGKVAAHGWEYDDHSWLFSNTLFFSVRHNCNQAQETFCTEVKLPDRIWVMYHQIPDRVTVIDNIELSGKNQQSCPTRVQMDFQ
ncbi:hypothetical protein M3Y98_00736900 [Aphelenchoides besseyi]|nr:hypothetical protein M3Y98_00736900 [Aphelenchoides besseyi]KAI6211425.1 hypothetical protein M3Y96_00432800 [Aphelenchoides besseyi]